MKLLELFAGSRSVSKVAEEMGWKTFSVDIVDFNGIDLVQDIEFLTVNMIPFIPDVIWASPPCTTYSIAGISHHRNTFINGSYKIVESKSELAKKSDKLVICTLELIKYYGCIYFIENPRGTLRKMPIMTGLPRVTVWYCKYGDGRAKPTDIWSNHIYSIFNPNGWHPRPGCFNNNPKCHHESAPRGSKTGTQGLNNDYDRSVIPYELCKEILTSCKRIEP